MRAARLHGPDDLRVEDIAEPQAGAGELLLQVAHNGICGSDLHLLRIPRTWDPALTLGHELAGTVLLIGDGVAGFSAGDRVCVQPNVPCRHCAPCASGLEHICQRGEYIGTSPRRGGGLAEKISIPADRAHRLPDSIGLDLGALIEPLSVGYNAVCRSAIKPGQHALVFGAGPIGIATYLSLRAVGVDDVVVVDVAPARRHVAANLGADVLDPSSVDVEAETKRRTGGAGVAVAFECAGAAAALDAAVASTGGRGTIVAVGMHLAPAPVQLANVIMNEKQIIGAYGYGDEVFPRVLELAAAGAFPTAGWVEHIPLDSIVEEGIRPFQRGEKMKILVDM